MSAMQLAKQAYTAFNREKPRSSITEWIEILTTSEYEDEAYDGIPEIVDSINIQSTGPAEASRAIRKKLKHGNAHQQYRALVILRAIVENGGHKFQTSFADPQLTDAIRSLVTDSSTDPKVRKKVISSLTSWHAQYKDDPDMQLVANLARQCRIPDAQREAQRLQAHKQAMEAEGEERRKRDEEKQKKEEEKRKAKEEKAKQRERREEEERRKKAAHNKVKRKAFNFEQEKPQVLIAIANASQASNNLVNAITLVDTEHDSLQNNERVQDCLAKAKLARKQIVRYIQLVENEDMIGTLIESNDRIIAALESYDTLSKPNITETDVKEVQEGLAAAKLNDSELGRLQEKQRAAVQRSIGRTASSTALNQVRGKDKDTGASARRTSTDYVHPDLQDLNFGPLGAEKKNLPPPLRPSAPRTSSDEDNWGRGSLSDFSDYQSSDEEIRERNAASSSTSPRGRYFDEKDEEEDVQRDPHQGLLEEDPFADPFADQNEVPATELPSAGRREVVW